jgi:hypothetical protein
MAIVHRKDVKKSGKHSSEDLAKSGHKQDQKHKFSIILSFWATYWESNIAIWPFFL